MLKRIVTGLAILLAGCGAEPEGQPPAAGIEASRPLVIATNYPLYFFASNIAGGSVEVVLPAITGDPAEWKPDSETIALMQSADLVLLNGAGYESWLQWVSLPESRLLDTSEAFRDQLIPLQEETVHQHGPGGEHSHTGVAFTVWLDPELAAEQARAIERGLSRLVPGKAGEHAAGLADLNRRLGELDAEFRRAFRDLGDQAILFSHPVYQYLERRYSLNGLSLHWEPDVEPGAAAWVELQDILRSHPAKLMIWEDDPAQETADRLAESGIRTVTFRTASNVPPGGDFFDVMSANIDRLHQ